MGRAFDRAEYTPPYAAMAASGLQINGNFEIAQELLLNTQATAISATPKYIADQWQIQYVHTANTAVFKGQVAGPGGAHLGNSGNYLEMIATTPSAMAAANDFALIQQPIEGLRWAKLSYGASVAKSVVVGFWAFATVAGTAAVSIRNGASNRSYVAEFTVNSPNTFEYKTVIIPGDITGTWVSSTAMGAVLGFCFGGNTQYNGTNGIWQGTNAIKTSAVTNFFATASNRVVLAGVTIMPGGDIPSALQAPLLQRTLPEEILLCQRYYCRSYELGTANGANAANGYISMLCSGSATQLFAHIPFPVSMRIAPTMSMWSFNGTANNWSNGAGTNVASGGSLSATSRSIYAGAAGAGLVLGTAYLAQYAADARL